MLLLKYKRVNNQGPKPRFDAERLVKFDGEIDRASRAPETHFLHSEINHL
jgi:hypothetical protein